MTVISPLMPVPSIKVDCFILFSPTKEGKYVILFDSSLLFWHRIPQKLVDGV